MPVDKFGRMSDAKTRDTGVSLTYINNSYIRSDGGTPVSGSIDMRGNTLYKMSDPVNPQDVATKEYADKVGGGETAIIKTRYGNYGALGNISRYNRRDPLHINLGPLYREFQDSFEYEMSSFAHVFWRVKR